ncbi:MAG: polysaccharide deacetylase family protein [bacterium]|nr:polysaccharide deacetylase family protein [bacterium]
MRPDVFEDLLIFLKEHFWVRPIGDLGPKDSDRPTAVLSFDDGYYDFLEFALPLLRKYGFRANMNIVPECVITGRPIWNVRLYDFLAAASRKQIDYLHIPGLSITLKGESPSAKLRYGLQISRFLKSRARRERQAIWKSIESVVEEFDGPSTRMMNANEVRQIAEFTDIGAHSYSHESMGYEETGFLENDLEQCQKFFSEELSIKLDTYAFPNGSYRQEQVEYLLNNGVELVLLVDEKFAKPGSQVLPRITLYGGSRIEVISKALNY